VLAWLGLVSYGIFLWHFTLTRVVDDHGGELGFVPLLPLAVLVTVPVAAASYYLVERPLLRFKDRRPAARGAGRGR